MENKVHVLMFLTPVIKRFLAIALQQDHLCSVIGDDQISQNIALRNLCNHVPDKRSVYRVYCTRSVAQCLLQTL